jgi:hypothetical protein
MENTRKYLALFEEYAESVHEGYDKCAESIETYSENTQKVLKRTRRQHQRIVPYSPNTPRDIKLSEIYTKTKNILDLRSSTYVDKKTISRYCPFKLLHSESYITLFFIYLQQFVLFGRQPAKTEISAQQ